MVKYICKRIVLMIPLFIGITFVIYFLSSLAPGNIVDNMASSNPDMTQEQIDQLYIDYGLNKPIVVRYVNWLKDLAKGDMGISYRTSQKVSIMVGQRIGPTIMLTGTSLIIALLIGIPLGVLSAMKPKGIFDNIASVLTFLGSSLPNFFVALVLIFIFAVKLKVLPSSGMYASGQAHTITALAVHLILPAGVLGFHIMGNFIKQTRGSMLEVLNEEYIKTARSKGISEGAVIIKHALRNALIPIVTQISLMVPFLIGGAVVIEQIFGWPGLGTLMNISITARDYPAIMGVAVVISIVVLLSNIVLDLVYAALDPRISYT
ncbi:MAG: ABC transporter permease [Eubacteriales bacterium]|nr:ABC transporter permease [Eubacteriales bacterium]